MAYAAVGGIRANAVIEIRFVLLDAEDGSETLIGEGRLDIATEGPLSVTEIAFPLTGIVLPEAGDYRFRLLWEGEEIAERRILVKQIGDVV